MRKLFVSAILIIGTIIFISCSSDDDAEPVEFFAPPMVPFDQFDVIFANEPAVIPFTITLDSDLTGDATWTLSSTGDVNASIGGNTSGTVSSGTTVNVDVLGASPGDASITLTVTNPPQDPEQQSTEAKVNFNIN